MTWFQLPKFPWSKGTELGLETRKPEPGASSSTSDKEPDVKLWTLESNLSPHFKLKELCITTHREINNFPPVIVIERLVTLANEFLEPIRRQFGAIKVNSGYRCPELNKAIGGAKQSAHMYGCAADIDPLAVGVTTEQIVRWVRDESGLNFDQVIDEYSSTANWVHIGMLRPSFEKVPRKQALLFKGGKYFVFPQ